MSNAPETADTGPTRNPYAPADLGTAEVTANGAHATGPRLSMPRTVSRALGNPGRARLVDDGGTWYLEPGEGGRVDYSLSPVDGDGAGYLLVGARGCRLMDVENGDEVVAHDAGGQRVRLEVVEDGGRDD